MLDTVDVTIPVSAAAAEALRADPVARARAGEVVSHLFEPARDEAGALLAAARSLAEREWPDGPPRTHEDRERFGRRLAEALRACQEEAARNGLTAEMLEEELRAYNAERRASG